MFEKAKAKVVSKKNSCLRIGCTQSAMVYLYVLITLHDTGRVNTFLAIYSTSGTVQVKDLSWLTAAWGQV